MTGLCDNCNREASSLKQTAEGDWVCSDCWLDLGYADETLDEE